MEDEVLEEIEAIKAIYDSDYQQLVVPKLASFTQSIIHMFQINIKPTLPISEIFTIVKLKISITKSYPNVAPSSSILELINKGYDPSYLVLGKTIQGESDNSNGYVPLDQMTTIVKQAFQTPSLNGWCKTGGEMIWYYNTQGQNTENNKQVLNYFGTISKF